MSLHGHKGYVPALSATKDVLVSGSGDRTVRIWDLNTGHCTHVFGGHKHAISFITIIKPEWIELTGGDGVVRREKWPKRTMIVANCSYESLHVWLLPRLGEVEDRHFRNEEDGINPVEVLLHSYSLLYQLTRSLHRWM